MGAKVESGFGLARSTFNCLFGAPVKYEGHSIMRANRLPLLCYPYGFASIRSAYSQVKTANAIQMHFPRPRSITGFFG